MNSFWDEFHFQLQEAAAQLRVAVAADDPFLTEVARARIRELGELASRHREREVEEAAAS